ncbi:MAG: hypothetical protein JWQ89_1570 [Devosia sp.]|uniref:ATP/GTP-binding protein n=1 Tax=Devosia sp. TaxID=1871048 RepID=UPI00262DF654|nr:ATP/GTP-binding protein [Devosia sp.]MDB5539843.1 hypothetical protein [Devosia sp.]
MLIRTSVALGLVLAGTMTAAAQTATEAWRLGGLKTPESVIFDKANNRLIVGNIGAFGDADGYLSTVSPDGKLVNEQWVTGLTDPKGMAIIGDNLFIADATGLVEVKLTDGSIVTTHPLEGAQLLNDVATDGSTLYVTDTFGQSIYRVEGGKAEKWLTDDKLLAPNGVFMDGDKLLIGGLGAGIKPDFSVTGKGGLVAVDLASKAITAMAGATGLSMSDGVAKLGNTVVFDDNPTGTIYGYADGKATPITTLGAGTADLWVDGDMLYVPLMQTGELVALKLE